MMRRSRARAGAIAALLLSAACATRAAAPDATQTASARQAAPRASRAAVLRLARTLTPLFADPRLAHASWAVDVRSLANGEVLYTRDADRLMIPGSNQKLLSTAVAADRLGWDFRFTTRLLATGPVAADGTLEGSLIVQSDGDPSINPRDPRRWRAFDDWAQMLADRGIRVVRDHLVGDDTLLGEPGLGDGWSWDDLQYGYGSAFGALQYNENQIEVSIGPGMTPGARAIIATSPLGSGLAIANEVVTAAPKEQTSIELLRLPGAPLLTVRGRIAIDARSISPTAAARNPTDLYLTALREALGRHGIVIGGRSIDIDDLEQPIDITSATELLVDRSPSLAEIVDVTLKWSRNGYAETLLTALSPTRPATASQGLAVVGSTLRDWGIADEEHVSRDGSGLSRYNYLTARLLTSLLTHMWADPRHREAFRSSLPLAGESGTLAERMKGTAAAGRVWAKTGTLSNVRSLSGYVLTKDNEPLAFSIIANHFRTPASEVDELTDRAVVQLAEFSRR